MKKTATILAGMFFLLIFLVPQAHALKAVLATIISGQVQVIGIQAAKKANITWDGNIVTKANGGGSFQFKTTDLPSTCVGTLSDGVSTIDVVIESCQPALPAVTEIVATGQTKCDTSGVLGSCPGTPPGQDGELQKGAVRSYTDHGDGTITDNATGLMWERLGNLDGTAHLSDPHDADNTYMWADAFGKIAALNAANFAGQNDWRLPNINELQTLVDYGLFFVAMDAVFYNGTDSFTQASYYWSSTSWANAPSVAWFVDFFDGVVAAFPKSAHYYVRAVRGGS